MWEEAFLAKLRDRFPPRRKYLVAVSGGCDSVVLLDLLVRAGYRKLVVCHLNHGLRGRASSRDADFVRRLAQGYGLPEVVEKVNAAREAEQRGVSLETAGRACRHEFYARAAAALRCPRVVLAHHAGDQVETVLMNFFRGSGKAGLSGMKPVTGISVAGRTLELCRPLLDVPRAELRDYAARHGLRFHEDESNASAAFLRNRIRHQLLPELENTFGRDVQSAVRRAAILAADEDTWMDELAADALGRLLDASGHLRLRPFLSVPLALQRRVLFRWLKDAGVEGFGFEDVERVRELAVPTAQAAKLNLKGNVYVRRRAGKLFIEG